MNIYNNVKVRNHQIDVLKTFAIILVVFGHSLECISGGAYTFLYKLIYSFDMPLFVFISGYLAKFDIRKMIKKLFIPLIIFDIVYIVLHSLIFDVPISTFDFPFWLMWYLLSLFVWRCTVPLLDKIDTKRFLLLMVLFVSIIIALLVGYAPFIDRKYSFSRTITFFPFFVLGYLFKKHKIEVNQIFWLKLITPLLLVGAVFALIYIPFDISSFYLADAYFGDFNSGDTIYQRLAIYFIAFSVIMFLLCYVPSFKSKGLQVISNNTLYVYLLHGIIIELIKAYTTIKLSFSSVLIAFVLSVVFVLAVSYLVFFCQKKLKKYG